jgi:hypothetical protein
MADTLGAIAESEKPRSSLARLLPERNLAETLYGTVLVTAVLVGSARAATRSGRWRSAVLVTAAVFATAHAWALAMASSAEARQPFGCAPSAAGWSRNGRWCASQRPR